MWAYHDILIYSSVHRHLGSLQLGAIFSEGTTCSWKSIWVDIIALSLCVYMDVEQLGLRLGVRLALEDTKWAPNFFFNPLSVSLSALDSECVLWLQLYKESGVRKRKRGWWRQNGERGLLRKIGRQVDRKMWRQCVVLGTQVYVVIQILDLPFTGCWCLQGIFSPSVKWDLKSPYDSEQYRNYCIHLTVSNYVRLPMCLLLC